MKESRAHEILKMMRWLGKTKKYDYIFDGCMIDTFQLWEGSELIATLHYGHASKNWCYTENTGRIL